MPLSLLQIIQNCQGELGLPQSATVIGNPDLTTLQMFSLANRMLDEMRRLHPTGWSSMMSEFQIVVTTPKILVGDVANNSPIITNILPSTAGITANFWTLAGSQIPQAARVLSVDSLSQVTLTMEATGAATTTPLTFSQDTYPYPTDYDWTQNRTQWDRTNRWELLGPDSAQMDQWHRSGVVVTGPRRHWRRIGHLANQFRIWPQPAEIANPLQLAFEYLSINAVAVHGSTTTSAQYFANDDDQPFLDDAAITMGIKYKFWEIKGFNYSNMKNEWIDYVDTLISRDEGAGTLQLTKRQSPIFLSPSNVQDGFFPGPVGPSAP